MRGAQTPLSMPIGSKLVVWNGNGMSMVPGCGMNFTWQSSKGLESRGLGSEKKKHDPESLEQGMEGRDGTRRHIQNQTQE